MVEEDAPFWRREDTVLTRNNQGGLVAGGCSQPVMTKAEEVKMEIIRMMIMTGLPLCFLFMKDYILL